MTEEIRNPIDEKNHQLVEGWDPDRVFTYFADLSFIPRGSGNVAKVADFLEKFAAEHGFASQRDDTGNVIIRKPAQNSSAKNGVILQAHQDMVCDKVAESKHDFLKDPIELVKRNDPKDPARPILCANGTTLGADDGIGVAIAMAVLTNKEISHPPLEALFTVDEETDMKGAEGVNPDDLKGTVLINLDAEDLNVAYISSAAGVSSQLTLPLITDADSKNNAVYRLVEVNGLEGGHSGVEINKARANAYVLLARLLKAADKAKIPFSLHTFMRGDKKGTDNAIPNRAQAVVGLASEQAASNLDRLVAEWDDILKNEYRSSDKNCTVVVEKAEKPDGQYPALTAASRDLLLNVVTLLPLGVFRFIQTDKLITGMAYSDLLVETSCNMGIASIADGKAELTLLARGSTASVLDDVMTRIKGLAALAGGSLDVTHETKGWEMPANYSPVQQLFEEQGLKLMGVHAGLECGCLVDLFKNAKPSRHLDAIAVGPDLKEVHTPNERLYIDTVPVLWRQLLEVLKRL